MIYDFIEIGTSDFDTLLQSTKNKKGLSIEPLKLYLDRLPENDSVTKINVGISDKISKADFYYIKPEDIIKYNLPSWVKGCNSINSPHKTVYNLLGDKHDEIVSVENVEIWDWEKLINEYNIVYCDYLKIDTEGHDLVILKNYFKVFEKYGLETARTIIMERNVLSNINDIDTFLESKKGTYNHEIIGDDVKLTKIISQ